MREPRLTKQFDLCGELFKAQLDRGRSSADSTNLNGHSLPVIGNLNPDTCLGHGCARLVGG
jgi:hypothetical protein